MKPNRTEEYISVAPEGLKDMMALASAVIRHQSNEDIEAAFGIYIPLNDRRHLR